MQKITLIVIIIFYSLSLHADSNKTHWTLWPTPELKKDIPSISQNLSTSESIPQGGHGIGQSFIPVEDTIYRITLQLKNRSDERPFTLKIWPWEDSNFNQKADDKEYLKTITLKPLVTEAIIITGDDGYREINVFPSVKVIPGKLYYMELNNASGDAEFASRIHWGGKSGKDAYPQGQLRINNHFRGDSKADLYFSIYAKKGNKRKALTCINKSSAPCPSPPPIWRTPQKNKSSQSDKDYHRNILKQAADTWRTGIIDGSESIAPFSVAIDAYLHKSQFTKNTRSVVHALNTFKKIMSYRQRNNKSRNVGFEAVERTGWAYRWIKDSPLLTKEDHRLIKTLILDDALRYYDKNRETGPHNRTLGGIVTLKLATTLITKNEFSSLSKTRCSNNIANYCSLFIRTLSKKDHQEWKIFAKKEWERVKKNWTLIDESSHYHSLSWRYILELIELYDDAERVWSDPKFLSLVENFSNLVLPTGLWPSYGDAYGIGSNWTGYLWLFEEAAKRLQSPHYKFLAQQLTDFRRRFSPPDQPAWKGIHNEWIALAHTNLNMDSNLRPKQEKKEHLFTITKRNDAYRRRLSEKKRGISDEIKSHFVEKVSILNDKLILKSGYSSKDMFLVLSLLGSWFEHSHEDIGSILAFGSNESLILTPPSFYDRRHQDHNSVISQRYTGGQLNKNNIPKHAEIVLIEESNKAIKAYIEWNNLSGWPIKTGRNIYFIKNRFIFFRDYAEAISGSLYARTGSIWHSAAIGAYGTNWFSLFNPELTGVNGMKFYNPEQYGLLYFLPRHQYITESGEIDYNTGNPSSPKKLLSQSLLHNWKAGERKWFDSILIPHGSETSPSDLAQNINVIFDDGIAVIIEIIINNERWLIVDNPQKKIITTSEVSTDARSLIFSEPTNITSSSVKPYLLIKEASQLTLPLLQQTTIFCSWPEPTTIETKREEIAQLNQCNKL